MADLYTLTLGSGTVLRYTSTDIDVLIEGNLFSSDLVIKRDRIKVMTGLEVDSLDVTVYPDSSTVIDGIPFTTAVRMGALDGAIFLLERAFFTPVDWDAIGVILAAAGGDILMDSMGASLSTGIGRLPVPTYVGKITRFLGVVSDIDQFTGTEVPITVKSYLQLLDIGMPRNLYQPTCRRTLFDAGCALLKSSWITTGLTVSAGSTKSLIMATLPSSAGSVNGKFAGYAFGTADGTLTDFSVVLPHAPSGVTAVYFNGSTDLTVTVGGAPQTIGYGQVITGVDVTISFDLPPDPGTVITVDLPYVISGYYDLGTVTFTSGLNTGVSRAVKLFTSGTPATLAFALPWPNAVAPGDRFSICPGCDKQADTCTAKFSNLAHFSAEPYVPAPETAY